MKNRKISRLLTLFLSFGLVLSGCNYLESILNHKNETSDVTQEDTTNHVHTFTSEWTSDKDHHWHESTCGHNVRNGESSHVFVEYGSVLFGNYQRICSICNYVSNEPIHYHTYETAWTYNETYHWHKCTCGHDVTSAFDFHTFSSWSIVDDATCTRRCLVCGYTEVGDYLNTVLVDNTYESFNLFGNNRVVVNGEDVNNDWAVKEFNGMTAISLKQAKAIDEGLYTTLKTKDIKGLYKFEGLVLGTNDAGWETAKMVDGVKETVNGSYAFKACGCDKNEDEEWIKTCHFPSAEAHGESLTPATCFVTENTAEEVVDGFDHHSNPVALEAGVYTAVVATYKTAVGAMGLTCGVGLIKTADRVGI